LEGAPDKVGATVATGAGVAVGTGVGTPVGARVMAFAPVKQKSHDFWQASFTERLPQVCNFPLVLFLVQYSLNLNSFFFGLSFFVIQTHFFKLSLFLRLNSKAASSSQQLPHVAGHAAFTSEIRHMAARRSSLFLICLQFFLGFPESVTLPHSKVGSLTQADNALG